MKIVAALDSFKGSLSSQEACDAVLQGCARAFAAKTTKDKAQEPFTGLAVPISDGGEGLIDCLKPLLLPQGYEEISISVMPPVLIRAPAATAPAKTAASSEWTLAQNHARMLVRKHECVLESAQALGLPLVPPEQRHIRQSSTYCLGQLLQEALDRGCTDIKIGLGGTCTNDCGLGMAQALGVKFSLDTKSKAVTSTTPVSQDLLVAGNLGQIVGINSSALEMRLRSGVKVTGLTDVSNPLTGPQGATHIFARQKGATDEDIAFLEAGMCSFARVLHEHYGQDLSHMPGAGAAGGLGAALLYFLHGSLQSGIEALLNILEFEKLLQGCDLVIVGEGSLDQQSLAGKAPVGVAKRAAALGIPVIALCGNVKGDSAQLQQHHIARAYGLTNNGLSLDEAIAHATEHLSNLAADTLSALMDAYPDCNFKPLAK